MSAGAADAEPSSAERHLPCVLLVDDDVALRRPLRRELEAAGFEVVEAEGPGELSPALERRP